MKRLIIIIILTFFIISIGKSIRIITNLDIANWYINSDLVMICDVDHIDTLKISKYDTIIENNIRLKYEIAREKYSISIDSMIKGKSKELINKAIITPPFRINYSRTKEHDKKFTGFYSKGDSVYEISVSLWDDGMNEDSYFRLKLEKKQLVILKRINNQYEIEYASECSKEILALIGEVKKKGQSYMKDYLEGKTINNARP